MRSSPKRQSDASGGRDDPRHSDSGFPRRRPLRRSSQSYENLSVRMKSGSGMRASASCEDLSHLVAERSSASDDVLLLRRSRISSAPVSRKPHLISCGGPIPTNKSADGDEKPTIFPDLTTLVRSHLKKQGVGQQDKPPTGGGACDKKDNKGYSLSGLAACLIMVTSPCVDITADAEVGSLIASGHVDILTAKVCTMPPVVTAPPLVGMPTDQPSSANDGNTSMTAFLEETVDSRAANEAACLTSGSYDEAPTPSASRVMKMAKASDARLARMALAIEEEDGEEVDADFSPRVLPSPKVF